MVVQNLDPAALDQDEVDRVFGALADATRRDIVVRVLREEQSVSALARRYQMSFAAVQKHVAVLERAALVRKQRRGREQMVSGDVETIRAATRLLDAYEAIWRGRVDRIGELLAEDVDDERDAP
jgi:DNA-binding transcriptional ArsR family regulator